MLKPLNLFWDAETVETAIYQALGAASVCWEHPEKAGIFDSDRAKFVGEQLIERLMELSREP